MIGVSQHKPTFGVGCSFAWYTSVCMHVQVRDSWERKESSEITYWAGRTYKAFDNAL
jgi:hypothetical protein